MCVASVCMCVHDTCVGVFIVCVCMYMCVLGCQCMYEYVGRVSARVLVQKRVNAGSPGSHLISYLAVMFRSLMAWGRSCLGFCWFQTWCVGTACHGESVIQNSWCSHACFSVACLKVSI